jgi:hypothetical protein
MFSVILGSFFNNLRVRVAWVATTRCTHMCIRVTGCSATLKMFVINSMNNSVN